MSAGHLEAATEPHLPASKGRSAGFWKNRRHLQKQINRRLDELNILDEEVRDAHAREERRKEEYVIEREISSGSLIAR